MIPILYEKGETAFTSNGLGRLRDCIDCVCYEERNGVYEVDFSYPVDGVNYDRIQLGRIIAVEHDETNDVQPFDIVSYSRPINGIVTFHCTHISYRQCALTASGNGITTLSYAFTMLRAAKPNNPFYYKTDINKTGYIACTNGIPHTVRQMLGGMEGSLLDTFGGEYEWDKWTVNLWENRGELKPFTIRYGVNLADYTEEVDYADTYTSVIPYWLGQDTSGNDVVITGDIQSVSYPSFNGQGRCVPLDVTDKFEEMPTKAQVEASGLAYIRSNQTYLPAQNITVDFVRISDTPEYAQFKSLQTCKLCDSIRVEFPRYNMTGTFKIVRTEYDVLQERYNKLELGTLSTSLAEALGISQESSNRLTEDVAKDFVVSEGTSGNWTYKKWNSGKYEAWYNSGSTTVTTGTSSGNGWYRNTNEYTIVPPSIGITAVTHVNINVQTSYANLLVSVTTANSNTLGYYVSHLGSLSSATAWVSAYIYGTYA